MDAMELKEAEMEFPMTIAAVRKHDGSLWDIGDALIAECGPPGKIFKKDGSYKKLKKVAAVLESLQFTDYPVNTLSRIRATAFKFKKADRQSVISWAAHVAADSPEMLNEILSRTPTDRKTKRGKPRKVSPDYVRGARKIIEKEKQKKRRTKGPQTDESVPVEQPKPMYFADLAYAASEAASSLAHLKETRSLLDPWLESIDAELLDDLVERLTAIETAAQQLRKDIDKRAKRPFDVIQGGKHA